MLGIISDTVRMREVWIELNYGAPNGFWKIGIWSANTAHLVSQVMAITTQQRSDPSSDLWVFGNGRIESVQEGSFS